MGPIVIVAQATAMRTQLRDYLTDLGHLVTTVSSVPAALEVAANHPVSMVVLDGSTVAASNPAGVSALHALHIPVIWTRSTPRGIAALVG
jgi:DNA-binding NtrC family response regulator